MARPIGEEDQHQQAEQQCRNTPSDEYPLPAFEAHHEWMGNADPIDYLGHANFEQRVTEHRADDLRDRRGDQKQRKGPRAIAQRKPVGEKHHDAGEKTGLGQTEKETHGVELRRRLHPRVQARDNSPRDHDAGDPFSGAPFLDDDCARNLEQEIAEKEQPGTSADHVVVEGRHVLRHGQLGECDVDTIDVRNHIADEQQRDQALVGLAPCAIQGFGSGASFVGSHKLSADSYTKRAPPFMVPRTTRARREAHGRRNRFGALSNQRDAAYHAPFCKGFF